VSLASPNLTGVFDPINAITLIVASVFVVVFGGLVFAYVWSCYRIWKPKVKQEQRGFEVLMTDPTVFNGKDEISEKKEIADGRQ
jgi:hypothetical protein